MVAGSVSIPTTVEEARCRPLPSFIVVGPPRTGTTWVHEVLSPHASLPSPTKETRFFDLHFDRGLDWYCDHFPHAHTGRMTGEVAPTYFASKDAPERIARTIPHVKLVFIFRHPVQRLVSLYRLKHAYGMLNGTLDEVLDTDPELIATSRYATHLRHWQSCFPAEQISINLFDDLVSEPQTFFDGLNAFIGQPRLELQDAQREQVFSTGVMTAPRSYAATSAATAMAEWMKARRLDRVVARVRNSNWIKLFLGGGGPFPEISPHTMHAIADLLRPEIDELETMLGHDLSAWKFPTAG